MGGGGVLRHRTYTSSEIVSWGLVPAQKDPTGMRWELLLLTGLLALQI